MGGWIETEADIARGVEALQRLDARFVPAVARAGLPPLRRRPGGFAGLLRIVCAQQVSVAAAEGMWRRIEAAGADEPARVAAMDEAALRACGLSRAKARYARGIAAAGLDYAALRTMPETDAVAALTALPGVGRWTAEVYLMVCAGRADVFAAGDLALQEGARLLFDLPARPAPRELAAMAMAWSPWRAVAARVLWAHYAARKRREGLA
jgi:DNA-3-methyladenine glycosylase II